MPDSSQGNTFTKFPLLPKELRLKIWNYAFSPRIISFHRDRDRGRFASTIPVKFLALTTLSPSLEILPRVCAESKAVSRKRYMDWPVWDIRANVSTIKFDPDNDVVYFSHEFARNVDHTLLREFAGQYPTETKQIKTLALPAVFSSIAISGVDVLKSLRLFESLTELVIVLGYSHRKTFAEGILVQSVSRSVAWGEKPESGQEAWVLPDGVEETLKSLKRDHWPDWKIPKVLVARFLDEVLRV